MQRHYVSGAVRAALLAGLVLCSASGVGAVDKPPKGDAPAFGATGIWLPGLMYGAQGATGLSFVSAWLDNVRIAKLRTQVTFSPLYVQYSYPFRLMHEKFTEPLFDENLRLIFMQQVGASLGWNFWWTEGMKTEFAVTGLRENDWADPKAWSSYDKHRIPRHRRGDFLGDEAGERRRDVVQGSIDFVWDNLDEEYGSVNGNPLAGWRSEIKVVASQHVGQAQGYTRLFFQLEKYVKLAELQTLVASFIGRWTDRTLPPYALQSYGGADYFPNQALRGYILSYFWGDWLWNFSAEWRFRVWSGKTLKLGGVAFLDSGGVGSYVEAEHPGYDRGPFFGGGAGLRIFIGNFIIVRLDFAVPRVPTSVSPGDPPWNFVHFGLGQTF